ncbi:MAG: hypothetical protein DWQ04_26025 [Chloroflexi bacterium]|nr:MAG: hypothetical protein DWQ04_26025 [Chloroflexota bacterium]
MSRFDSIFSNNIFVLLMLTGCTTAVSPPPVTITTTALHESTGCTNRFVAHELNHVTTVSSEPVTMFDSNGAGVGINDLDNDNDLDIVLANLQGNSAIFWNEGRLVFRKEPLTDGDTRAVNIVDVDGDALAVDLFWTGRLNQQALGAEVVLVTGNGRNLDS